MRQVLTTVGHVGEISVGHLDLASIWRAIRQGYLIIISCLVIFVTIAVTYLATATSSFTGSASILIDPYRTQSALVDQPLSDSPVDASIVDTQAELIKSEAVSRLVIKRLGSDVDHLLLGTPKPSILPPPLLAVLTWIQQQLARGSDDLPGDQTQTYITALQDRLYVKRVGLTFVILISFRSDDPVGAAQVANAVADAYLDDQINAKVAASQRLSGTLSDRAAELQQEATKAARKVQTYQGGDQIVLQQLNAAAAVARSSLDVFQRRAMEVEQSGANSVSDARLVSPAYPPPKRSWPRSSLVLGASIFVGLLFGVGLAFLRQLFTTVYHSIGDVEVDFRNCIADLRVRRRGTLRRNLRAGRLTSADVVRYVDDVHSALSDAVRQVAAHFDPVTVASDKVSIGVLSLRSPFAGDLLACGLAVAAAKSSKDTLLIDANSDSSFLAKCLDLNGVPATIMKRESPDIGAQTGLPNGTLTAVSLGLDGARDITPDKVRVLTHLGENHHSLVVVSFAGSDIGAIAAWIAGLQGFVICIERHRTRRDMVRSIFKIPGVSNKCIGAVLCSD